MTPRTLQDLLDEANAVIEEVSVDQLAEEIASGDCVVVDIRDIRERLKLGAIPGAVSAPRGMLEFWFAPDSPYYRKGYDTQARYVFYCAGGMRSALATKVTGDLGYENVASLATGFTGWTQSGGDVEDVAATSKWVERR